VFIKGCQVGIKVGASCQSKESTKAGGPGVIAPWKGNSRRNGRADSDIGLAGGELLLQLENQTPFQIYYFYGGPLPCRACQAAEDRCISPPP